MLGENKVKQITNLDGVTFNVRIVLDGDKYGRNSCLVHNGEPLIEFYDTRFENDDFGKLGYFVSRYYVDTLLEDSKENNVLWLDTGNDEWVIDRESLNDIKSWAKKVIN